MATVAHGGTSLHWLPAGLGAPSSTPLPAYHGPLYLVYSIRGIIPGLIIPSSIILRLIIVAEICDTGILFNTLWSELDVVVHRQLL